MSHAENRSAEAAEPVDVTLDPQRSAFGGGDSLESLGRTHFIGIGGAGMSVLAEMLHERGVVVDGSDREPSTKTDKLASLGIEVQFGQRAENVRGAQTVVYSSAIKPDNPEIVEAAHVGARIVHRSDILALLMATKTSVSVAGAHGKTTTSSLLAHILVHCGTGVLADPSYAIGGSIQSPEGEPLDGGHSGRGEVLVAEADESDGSFEKYRPQIAVVVNAEADHLDHYGDAKRYQQAFVQYASHAKGVVVMSADDEGSRAILRALPSDMAARTIAYTTDASLSAQDLSGGVFNADPTERRVAADLGSGGGSGLNVVHILSEHESATEQGAESFTIDFPSGFKRIGFNDGALHNGEDGDGEHGFTVPVRLRIPGVHNARNATAAIICSVLLGMDPVLAAEAASSFLGASRRFEVKGETCGVSVVDDYAHHPTEIAALLAAAKRRYPQAKIRVLFQPHLFSRTKFFTKEFAQALALADDVMVTSIYPAREKQSDFPGVTAQNVVDAAKGLSSESGGGRQMRAVASMHEAAKMLALRAEPGDVVLTVGAGDVTQMGSVILAVVQAKLGQRNSSSSRLPGGGKSKDESSGANNNIDTAAGDR